MSSSSSPSSSSPATSPKPLDDAKPPPPLQENPPQISCPTCSLSISIRADGFTTKAWEEHRRVCRGSTTTTTANPCPYPPSPPSTATFSLSSPTKRRRAKRTEEERISYLKHDPYVAQFEAYRVLCKSCDKWIRLRPNSTYCSIPWDAHRKSCLAKKTSSHAAVAAAATAASTASTSASTQITLEQRNNFFTSDPQVRKFDAERVLCANCDTWIGVSPIDHENAVGVWTQHRERCVPARPVAAPPPTTVTENGSSPTPHDVLPHHHQLPPPPSSISGSDSRRRSAHQRLQTLLSDPLITHVEPNRVFCSLCLKWVQLRQDSSYCAYPWVQHRGKCLRRWEKRGGGASTNRDAPVGPPTSGRVIDAPPPSSSTKQYLSRHHPYARPSSGSPPPSSSSHHIRPRVIQPSRAPPPRSPGSSYSGVVHNLPPLPPLPNARPSRERLIHIKSEPDHDDGPEEEPDIVEIPPPSSSQARSAPSAADRTVRNLRPLTTSYSRHNSEEDAEGDPDPEDDDDDEAAPPRGDGSRRAAGGGENGTNGYHHHIPPFNYNRYEDGHLRLANGNGFIKMHERNLPFSYHDQYDHRDQSHSGRHRRNSSPPPPPRHSTISRDSAPDLSFILNERRQPLDLSSSHNRLQFILTSIVHLFSTTFDPTGPSDGTELTIASLLIYLNSAMPIDFWEEYDTTEVVRGLNLLRNRPGGKPGSIGLALDGDVIRLRR